MVTEVLSPGSLYSKAEKKEFDRLTKLQSKMDFTHADANDPGLLNEILVARGGGLARRAPSGCRRAVGVGAAHIRPVLGMETR